MTEPQPGWQKIGETDPEGNPWTIETLFAQLDAHIEQFNTHGRNCACMDGFIRAFRELFGLTGVRPPDGDWEWFNFGEWMKSPEAEKRDRIRYILAVIVRTEDF